jgi:hypothetical protein
MPRLLRAELENADSRLARAFDRIYEESLIIWNAELHSEFTTHGQSHTEQVEANLDALTRPLQRSQNPLTEHEIFILLAGACLHDVGMQLIDDPDARANHAAAARQMILNSFNRVPSEERHITLPIEDDNAREAIANVAQAHWVDYALPLPSTDYINRNEQGRLRLLGLLLAMADLLDLSSVRAHYFRSSHRFFGLNPISELHHKKHKFVKGFTLGPPNKDVPGSLRFDVDWREKHGVVTIVNEWVMQSFNSTWRQIKGALYEESGGAITWTDPWTSVKFRELQGRPIRLSDRAENVLMWERAEQIRIDREAFALHFRNALFNKETAVFLFPAESDFDGRWLSEWCEAYSRSQGKCYLANVDVHSNVPFKSAHIVASIMNQWNVPSLTFSGDEDAIAHLQNFLRLHDAEDFLTIIKTNEAVSASLENLLEILVSRNSTAARICLLISPKAKGPAELGAASIIEFDGSVFSRTEIEDYLQKKHGFSELESSQLYERMQHVNLTAYPARVYTYIEDHCHC